MDKIPVEKKNLPFIQLSRSRMSPMRELVKKNPVAAEVLLYFIGHMDSRTNALIASYTFLQEKLGYSRATVWSAIKELKEGRWIRVLRSGNMSIYCVDPNVAWSRYRDEKHHAYFNAVVAVTSSEQTFDVTETQPKLNRVPAFITGISELDGEEEETG